MTAKPKLQATPEQFRALRQTQLAYRDALNYVSRYAFEHGKLSNKVGLQDGTYLAIRAQFGLPAQMACSVPRQVGATYKALWTKVKANAAARQAGQTKKRYKGLDQPPRYVSPTLTYQFGHDYSFKTGQQVSILTLEGRVVVPYTGYTRHVVLLQHGAFEAAITQLREMAHAGVTLYEPVRYGHIVLSARDAEMGQRFNMTRAETTTREHTCMDDASARAQWENEGGHSGDNSHA